MIILRYILGIYADAIRLRAQADITRGSWLVDNYPEGSYGRARGDLIVAIGELWETIADELTGKDRNQDD